MNYDVLQYGAKGDGTTNDTSSIQKAIDECTQNGGGRVLLSGGHVYRSGTLILKSNVELYLEMGAVLKGSDLLEDYNLFGLHKGQSDKLDVPTYENCEYNGMPTLYFIYAKDADHVAITGLGKIDGNEEMFYGKVTKWHIDGSFYPRVPLIFMEHVSHLSILNVTLTHAAYWTTHLVGCRDVLIEGLHILNNLRLANCDGIDPDRCQNVRISDCHIECADDCIVFKNTASTNQYPNCENIVVSGCTLISTSAAIKFGSESEDHFKNITVENCVITKSNRGISLQLRDRGTIENCIFSNIIIETRLFSTAHWWGKAEPIAITAVKRKEETKIGHVNHIIFQNIHTDGENGIFVYGDDSNNISNIEFNNVTVKIRRKTDWPNHLHDIRPTISGGIIEDKLTPIYVKNAKDIHFKNCSVLLDSSVAQDVEGYYHVENCENITLPD